MSTMHAVRFHADEQNPSVQRIDRPEPQAHQARLRVTLACVCDDDLRSEAMPDATGTVTMGREGVGTVESVGQSVDTSLVNQRATFECVFPCGECDLCRSGLSAHCPERNDLGQIGGADGCFAHYVIVPASALVAVPDGIDDERALHASRRVRIEGRPYITVLGDSRPALVMGQVLSRLNAQVRVVGRDEHSLALCEKWGIRHRPANEPGLHADQDVVVDCSGDPHAVELARAMVRPRGTVISTMPAGIPLPPATVVQKELDVLGTSGGRVKEGVALLEDDRYHTAGLITQRVKLADAPNGINAHKNGALAVAIEC